MRLHITAIVGFASAALASPTPSKTIEWVVQTGQCANLLTAAYGPDGPDILQQMNTQVVTNISSIHAGATLALPPPPFSGGAIVSTHTDSSATQEFLVIKGTCEPPEVDSTASTTHTSPSTPTTTGSTMGAISSTLGTDTSVATSGGESIAETMADVVATTTEASALQTTTGAQVTSTVRPYTGWLGDVCSRCYLRDLSSERTWFSCECGTDVVEGHLMDFVTLTTKGKLSLSPRGHFSVVCDHIDIEEPFKLIAMCGKERKSIELEYLWNDYLIAVEQNSNGDRYFFLQKAKPG